MRSVFRGLFNTVLFRYFPSIDIQIKTIPATNPQLSYLSATPSSAPIAHLAILHGYGDHAGRHSHVMQWLADRGIASYALDFRGHGRSAGKPNAIKRWDDYLDDLAKFLAIKELAATDTPLFILGHSHGGLVAAAAAMRGMFNHCQGVILSAPYLQLKLPVPLYKRMIAAVCSHIYPSLPIKSGMSPAMLTRDQTMIAQSQTDPFCRGTATPRWFTETAKEQIKVRSTPELFKLPLLMLIPGDDTIADSRASELFFENCGSTDKMIVRYPDNKHELLRDLDREKAFADILDRLKACGNMTWK